MGIYLKNCKITFSFSKIGICKILNVVDKPLENCENLMKDSTSMAISI